MRMSQLALAAGLAATVGCGEGGWSPSDNAALVLAQHVGSAVYVGHGRVVTNWHVCFVPLFDESLPAEAHTRFYNDPGDGSMPYVEGIAPTSFYCPVTGDGPGDLDYSVSPEGGVGCVPVSNVATHRLAFTRVGIEVAPVRLLFADWSLDLCVVEVDATARAALDAVLRPLAFGPQAVVAGDRVTAAGWKDNEMNVVGQERCTVTAGAAPVLDPDPIAPSPLEVPSFRLDCRHVEHGSSGSPVFDEGDRLVGFVWTGVGLGSDTPAVYVSAVSEWPARMASRPAAQVTQLSAMLGF